MERLFSLHGRSFKVCDEHGTPINSLKIEKLNGKTLYICEQENNNKSPSKTQVGQNNGPSVK